MTKWQKTRSRFLKRPEHKFWKKKKKAVKYSYGADFNEVNKVGQLKGFEPLHLYIYMKKHVNGTSKMFETN